MAGRLGRRIVRLALALGAVLIISAAAWRATHGPAPPGARPRAAAAPPRGGDVPPPITMSSGELTPAAAAVATPAALPGSLAGTEPDGEVTADAAGHLIVDLELRRLFDYFLAASGEEPIATMRARIIAVLRARLPAPAAVEAIEILDRYLAYREAARTLPPPADQAAGLDQIHALRRRMFSARVARAFFADEEAATYAALRRRDVLADPALAASERARRLAELDAETPAAVREARAAATAPIDQLDRELAMRAAGASDAQLAAARTAALGPEAATRLAELDRAHAAWDARVARFRAERAALLADPRLDLAERSRRVEELAARTFTPPERIRIDALDRIAAGSAGR
jgi:lipase chaperone LimK